MQPHGRGCTRDRRVCTSEGHRSSAALHTTVALALV
jgi:hypothetical protein